MQLLSARLSLAPPIVRARVPVRRFMDPVLKASTRLTFSLVYSLKSS
ncbi:hypothetical protein WN943_003728 [Citrus x changshan-huyou]